MKLLIIIPTFNEAQVIAQTISEIQSVKIKGVRSTILVVDDGSTDQTQKEAQKTGVEVISHPLNRGLGGAIGTGLLYAKRKGYDYALTIDADGQHDPKDIKKVLKPLQKKTANIVIGSRTISKKGDFPLDRKILNHLSNIFTYILFGIYSTDSQTGFRAFDKKTIDSIKIKTQRMEVSSEIFSEIKRLDLQYKEVPISVIYTDYSRAKGQTNLNSFQIITKLIIKLFR